MSRTTERPERPYLSSKELDDLMRMNLQLLSEVWVLRDRVTLLEHLLESKGALKRSDIDEMVPEGALASELDRERDAMVARVVGGAFDTNYSVEALKASVKR
jgi:hypothetical protein